MEHLPQRLSSSRPAGMEQSWPRLEQSCGGAEQAWPRLEQSRGGAEQSCAGMEQSCGGEKHSWQRVEHCRATMEHFPVSEKNCCVPVYRSVAPTNSKDPRSNIWGAGNHRTARELYVQPESGLLQGASEVQTLAGSASSLLLRG